MMKKWFGLLLALMLMLSVAVPVMAAENNIIDEVGLLSDSQWLELETRAQALEAQYGCGLYVVITQDYSDYGSTTEDACYGIYEAYGLGDPEGNAIVLMLSMAERDYYIQDFGSYGQFVMTDYGREQLEDAMLDELGNDDWAGGLSEFLNQGEVLLEAAEQGEALDTGSERTPVGKRIFWGYGIALVVGAVIALIVCSVMKAQMKTAVKATDADVYVAPSGVEMQIREDRYTHTTRTRRKIETGSGSSSSGSRGGSSGGGGKF